MSVYAGESYAKRLARGIVYGSVVDAGFWQRARDAGSAALVTLTGNEAAEVGVFRAQGVAPERCVFVDQRKDNSVRALQRWPGVNAVTADVVDFLREYSESISLVHLDFMGAYGPTVRDAMEACSRKIVPGGYVIWTFLRGRETESNPFWRMAKNIVRSKNALNLEPEAWETRRTGYISLATGALNNNLDPKGPRFVAVGIVDYDSGKSPMGMIVFKKSFPFEHRGKIKALKKARRLSVGLANALLPSVTLRGDAKAGLRRKICCECCLGKSPAGWLSDFFNLGNGTVPAWRAHATMGTYKNDRAVFHIIEQKRLFTPCPHCASSADAEAMGVPRNYHDLECNRTKKKILDQAPSNKYTRKGRAARDLQR